MAEHPENNETGYQTAGTPPAGVPLNVAQVASKTAQLRPCSPSLLGAANAQQTSLNGLYVGIFIPVGARGFLASLGARLATSSGGSETVTIFCSPTPSLSPIYSGQVTVAGTALRDYLTAINVYWNYDSIFVWILAPSNTLIIAYENTSNQGLSSPDAENWTAETNSYDTWANLTSQAQGIQEVGGIVNNIEIPGSSAATTLNLVILPPGVFTPIVDIFGSGYCDFILLSFTANTLVEETDFAIICDGKVSFPPYSPMDLNGFGFTAATPDISLLQYGANKKCTVLLTKKFEFKKELLLIATPGGLGQQSVACTVITSLIG